jgi:hypothetical protein
MLLKLDPKNLSAGFVSDRNFNSIFGGNDRVNQHLILKAHFTGVDVNSLLWLTNGCLFISIRDPRDAVLSFARRFNIPLSSAIHNIERSCDSILHHADSGHCILRYEDCFFRDIAVPQKLARELNTEISPQISQQLLERYSTERTRAFAARLTDLPSDRLRSTAWSEWDIVTQIHRTHIGDGRIGKWRDLNEPQQITLNDRFERFLTRFDYADRGHQPVYALAGC